MSNPTDWAALGKQAQKRAEEEASEKVRFAARALQDNQAKAIFRNKAVAAFQELRNICERNCGEYNANVSDLVHRVNVSDTTDGFLVSKGNGVVHASFVLDPLRSKRLTLSRESSMKHRNLHTYHLDVMEVDGKVYFGTVGVDFVISDSVKLANDACIWVMETRETAYQ
jgi:hypothetical protein